MGVLKDSRIVRAEKKFVQKSLKYREYVPPVIHLELLDEDEFDIAWQLVDAFEGAGVAFAVLMKKSEHELVLNTYGIITAEETLKIYRELRSMEEYKDYSITLE